METRTPARIQNEVSDEGDEEGNACDNGYFIVPAAHLAPGRRGLDSERLTEPKVMVTQRLATLMIRLEHERHV
ncbi:Protein of unknown function [Gryllus bimaculatus]|nr:Protein of unknown function [Gryllus bimaculatus]